MTPRVQPSHLAPLATLAALLATGPAARAHDGSHGNAELDAMIAAWRAGQAAAVA